jgi:hypothetical protein
MNEKIKDGTVIENNHGYPVGHCAECRYAQRKMYALDGKLYCISCFPKMVDLKNAISKLEAGGRKEIDGGCDGEK